MDFKIHCQICTRDVSRMVHVTTQRWRRCLPSILLVDFLVGHRSLVHIVELIHLSMRSHLETQWEGEWAMKVPWVTP